MAAALGALLTWLAATGVVPYQAIWAAAAFWPLALLAATIAYRALGHTLTDRYVITRSGMLTRETTVLQRNAVSTIAISKSLLQRRPRRPRTPGTVPGRIGLVKRSRAETGPACLGARDGMVATPDARVPKLV